MNHYVIHNIYSAKPLRGAVLAARQREVAAGFLVHAYFVIAISSFSPSFALPLALAAVVETECMCEQIRIPAAVTKVAAAIIGSVMLLLHLDANTTRPY